MDERHDGGQRRAVDMEAGERVGGPWRTYLIRGILAGLLGLFALFWPSTTIEILITLVGIFCVVDGLTGLFGAYRAPSRGTGMVAPLVSLVIGLVLLFWPGATVRTLLFVFGVWLLVIGGGQFLTARRARPRGGERGVMTTSGGLVALVGLVLVLWPGSGVVAISWLIAIPALLVAAILVFLALRLKRADERSAGVEP